MISDKTQSKTPNPKSKIFEYLASGSAVDDLDFDRIYPQTIRMAAEIHFTPVEVSKIAARFLVGKPGTKVLDIGSGAGKFCMVGAVCTEGHFTGVEQRESLCALADDLARRYRLNNVSFIHANITEIGFKAYDAFFLFNPFYENVCMSGVLDDDTALARHLYTDYSLYVKGQLDAMPIGTKLATYFSYLDEIPASYALQFVLSEGKLKLWEKVARVGN